MVAEAKKKGCDEMSRGCSSKKKTLPGKMSLGLRNEFRIDNESSSGTKRDLKGHGAGM